MIETLTPNRLVVMASYDPDGELGPHVRRHIQAWQDECQRLIVVTTSQLKAADRSWLNEHCELIERENYGYDFYSYKVGLDAAGDLSSYDEVVICNDSFVGPLRPYREIFAEMADQHLDFWGMTQTLRVKHHVQSFFVVFRSWVVASKAFTNFWAEMSPVSDRREVIHRYEVGMSRTLIDAGFTVGSFFRETPAEARLARARVIWWALRRRDLNRRRLLRPWERLQRAREPWNPMSGLADSALRGESRLPLVKLDTIRYDPYGLNSARLLRKCTEQYPESFAGMDDYLARTASRYRPRPREMLAKAPLLLRPFILLVRYR